MGHAWQFAHEQGHACGQGARDDKLAQQAIYIYLLTMVDRW